jgi:hypothetical protein
MTELRLIHSEQEDLTIRDILMTPERLRTYDTILQLSRTAFVAAETMYAVSRFQTAQRIDHVDGGFLGSFQGIRTLPLIHSVSPALSHIGVVEDEPVQLAIFDSLVDVKLASRVMQKSYSAQQPESVSHTWGIALDEPIYLGSLDETVSIWQQHKQPTSLHLLASDTRSR